MKTILITGAAGCIGTNLCIKLLQKGCKIIAVDNFITSSEENIQKLKENQNFVFFKHDVTKEFPKAIFSQLSSLTSIFHLACPTGVSNLQTLSEEMLLTNSLGTKNILDIALFYKTKLLFTSSSEVYGDPKEFPQKEFYTGNVDPVGYRSAYEEGKRFSESLITMYVKKYNVDARIVRVFNTFGPFFSPSETRAVPQFLTQAIKNKPLTIHGDGSQNRTFCYVDDLISALELIMDNGNTGEVYNAGSDQQITILQLAELIKSITKSTSNLEFQKRAKHDHQGRLPDISKLKALGWKQNVSLEDGILQTFTWLQSS